MPEHRRCKEFKDEKGIIVPKCKWNHYPECYCKIDEDGNYYKIDNLPDFYWCNGYRDQDKIYTDRKKDFKSVLELKLEELEAKIKILEEK